MKKRIIVSFLMAFCMILSGCGGDGNKELTGLGRFDGLDAETELEIIKSYFGDNYKGQESVDCNVVKFYYGAYSGCVVVRMFIDGWVWAGTWSTVIEETEFIYPGDRVIKVLKDGSLYRLNQAYANGYLTQDDLEFINKIDRKVFAVNYESTEDYFINQ